MEAQGQIQRYLEHLGEIADSSYSVSKALAVAEEGLFKCIEAYQTLTRFCPHSRDNLNLVFIKAPTIAE